MKKVIIASVVVVGISSAGYAVYSKLQADQTKQAERALKTDASPSGYDKTVDASYVANLLAQHADTLPLLQLVESRAEHQELKQLAADFTEIIQAEQKAISQLGIDPADNADTKDVRLPRYVTLSEFENTTTSLVDLKGDEFDKQFIKYLRIQFLSDNLLGYKIIEQTSDKMLRSFADKAIKDRLSLSARQSEWPEQWGYAPPHDG